MVKGTAVPLFVDITQSMIAKELVNQIVEDFIVGKNHYLVDLKVTPDNRISVEIDSFKGVSIDVCIDLNKYIESRLDREIEDYELEVSSAGLTEPFKVLKQYQKNIGNEVEVLTKTGLKYNGILVQVDDNGIDLEIEKMEKPEGAKRKILISEMLTFPYEEIKTTKYIIRFK